MMGRLETDQGRFFYVFCLEDHGPRDHLLRRIDRVLTGWKRHRIVGTDHTVTISRGTPCHILGPRS